MRARVLFAGLFALAAVAIAGPAWAKTDIESATITGPAIERRLRIAGSDTQGLWDSGIDAVGGLDDARADSVEDLGLTLADLGPVYLVTYRFYGRGPLIRQNLYPYARGGPVTYTPPGQEVTAGPTIAITAGWYASSHPCGVCGRRPPPPDVAARRFFNYLVEQGVPEGNPVASVAIPEPAPVQGSGASTEPRPPILLPGLAAGFAALGLVVLRARRAP